MSTNNVTKLPTVVSEALQKALTLKNADMQKPEIIIALANQKLSLTPSEEQEVFGDTPQFPVMISPKRGVWVPHPGHPDNLIYFIKKLAKYSLALNLLKNAMSLAGKEITDWDLALMRNEAQRYGLSAGIMDALCEVAYECKFHPWKDFVEKESWDGVDRITQLFETLTINPEYLEFKDLYFQYIRRFLIGSIAKVYRPGSQNLVPTFQGFQGAGKSRWCEKLAGGVEGVFAEGAIDPSSKDDMLKHLNYIFYHVSELEQVTRKKDQSAVKDYLTKSTVACRPAYGRFDRVGQSVCSFIATVNSNDFLSDDTGSRRFLCIPLKDIDAEHTINIQQLWAQAKSIFDSGERWWFDKSEIQTINEANDIFTQKNIVDLIASKIEPGTEFVTGVEIFRNFNHPKPFAADLSKLGALLRKAGIVSERRTINKVKLTGYLIKQLEPSVI